MPKKAMQSQVEWLFYAQSSLFPKIGPANRADHAFVVRRIGERFTGPIIMEAETGGSPMKRPVTTPFMLMSLDGKISTGAGDGLDFDRDLPRVPGVVEGLRQYYELEQETDLWSLNTGKVMAKVGANELPLPERLPVSFAIVDNTPYRCRRAVALRQVPGARRHHLERRTSCPCGGRA